MLGEYGRNDPGYILCVTIQSPTISHERKSMDTTECKFGLRRAPRDAGGFPMQAADLRCELRLPFADRGEHLPRIPSQKLTNPKKLPDVVFLFSCFWSAEALFLSTLITPLS
jgi:hypothetical protein